MLENSPGIVIQKMDLGLTIYSEAFAERLINCKYIHDPRESKISDHSAMALELS